MPQKHYPVIVQKPHEQWDIKEVSKAASRVFQLKGKTDWMIISIFNEQQLAEDYKSQLSRSGTKYVDSRGLAAGLLTALLNGVAPGEYSDSEQQELQQLIASLQITRSGLEQVLGDDAGIIVPPSSSHN